MGQDGSWAGVGLVHTQPLLQTEHSPVKSPRGAGKQKLLGRGRKEGGGVSLLLFKATWQGRSEARCADASSAVPCLWPRGGLQLPALLLSIRGLSQALNSPQKYEAKVILFRYMAILPPCGPVVLAGSGRTRCLTPASTRRESAFTSRESLAWR